MDSNRAFALNSDGSRCGQTNQTDAKDEAQCYAEYAEASLTASGGTNALSFTIGALTVIGFLYFIFYTSYGMVSLPISMIRSRGRAQKVG